MSPLPPQPSRPSMPALVDDLIVEILLRLPPDEPASLFRASLVCKHWRLLLSDPAFLRRYRELHRTPPLLGLLLNTHGDSARFVPTTAFRPPSHDLLGCLALDCRHGRALFIDETSININSLLLRDLKTGEEQYIPEPDIPQTPFSAAVLCATAGCDHLDCHWGPFLVAFVGTSEDEWGTNACLYSSETAQWSELTYVQVDYHVSSKLPPLLVGDALYFTCESAMVILRYNLGGDRDLSVIDLPGAYEGGIALMLTGDGGLGFAGFDMLTINLWSLEMGSHGVARWARHRVIDLGMLPIDDLGYPLYLIGFVKDGNSDIIFVSTYDTGVFMIELESKRTRQVCETHCFDGVFPYMSFCTPGPLVQDDKSAEGSQNDEPELVTDLQVGHVEPDKTMTPLIAEWC